MSHILLLQIVYVMTELNEPGDLFSKTMKDQEIRVDGMEGRHIMKSDSLQTTRRRTAFISPIAAIRFSAISRRISRGSSINSDIVCDQDGINSWTRRYAIYGLPLLRFGFDVTKGESRVS